MSQSMGLLMATLRLYCSKNHKEVTTFKYEAGADMHSDSHYTLNTGCVCLYFCGYLIKNQISLALGVLYGSLTDFIRLMKLNYKN